MWIPVLAFHEHKLICRATLFLLVPGKRRQGSSENWDWRSQARPILQNLIVSRWEWCVYSPCADKYRGKHETGHHARGCCFRESRRAEIFPSQPQVSFTTRCGSRISHQMLHTD